MPVTILPWQPSDATVTVAPVVAQENDDRFRELIYLFGHITNNQMYMSLHSDAYGAVRQGVWCRLVNSGGGAPYNSCERGEEARISLQAGVSRSRCTGGVASDAGVTARQRGVQRPSRSGGPACRALTLAALTCDPRRIPAPSWDLPVTPQVQPAAEQTLRRSLRIPTFRALLAGEELALTRVSDCC
jgi:hypothetical protein